MKKKKSIPCDLFIERDSISAFAYFCTMRRMKKLIVLSGLALLLAGNVHAQCAMCRANVESNMKDNPNAIGRGLNRGILYLLSIPYLLGGAAAVIYFKNRKKANQV
jgi:hypothetical protein